MPFFFKKNKTKSCIKKLIVLLLNLKYTKYKGHDNNATHQLAGRHVRRDSSPAVF